MRRVAGFGNAGGGKSTLARQLADVTGLPLYVLDIVQFREGRFCPGENDGGKIPHDEYVALHAGILASETWIIDGFDTVALTWERFAAADTLVHVDLPILTHYRRVTQRFVRGLFRSPPGWPAGSPVWESTLDSYRVIGLCHRKLTPRYRQVVADASIAKRVRHLRSPAAMAEFLRDVEREQNE